MQKQDDAGPHGVHWHHMHMLAGHHGPAHLPRVRTATAPSVSLLLALSCSLVCGPRSLAVTPRPQPPLVQVDMRQGELAGGSGPPEGARGPFSFHRMLAYRCGPARVASHVHGGACGVAAGGQLTCS